MEGQSVFKQHGLGFRVQGLGFRVRVLRVTVLAYTRVRKFGVFL